jgi:hypothetical protein
MTTTRINHSNCSHPRTAAGRRACRAGVAPVVTVDPRTAAADLIAARATDTRPGVRTLVSDARHMFRQERFSAVMSHLSDEMVARHADMY